MFWLFHAKPQTEAFQTEFWMCLHGSPTSKRTIVYSCMQEIQMLDLGPLTKAEKERRTKKKLTRHFPALAMVGWITSLYIGSFSDD